MESTRSIIRIGYDHPYSTISENMLISYCNGERPDFCRTWAHTSLDHSSQKRKGSLGRSGSYKKRRPPSRNPRKSATNIFSDDFLSEKAVSEITTVSVGDTEDCVTYTNGKTTVINISNGLPDPSPVKPARGITHSNKGNSDNITHVDVEYKPGRASNFNVRKTIENRRFQKQSKKSVENLPAHNLVRSINDGGHDPVQIINPSVTAPISNRPAMSKSQSSPNLLKDPPTFWDPPILEEVHVKKYDGSSRSLGYGSSKRAPLVSIVNITNTTRSTEDSVVLECSQEKDVDPIPDVPNPQTEIVDVCREETYQNGKMSTRTVITLGSSDPHQFIPAIKESEESLKKTPDLQKSSHEKEILPIPKVEEAEEVHCVSSSTTLHGNIISSSGVKKDFTWDFGEGDMPQANVATSTPICKRKSEEKIIPKIVSSLPHKVDPTNNVIMPKKVTEILKESVEQLDDKVNCHIGDVENDDNPVNNIRKPGNYKNDVINHNNLNNDVVNLHNDDNVTNLDNPNNVIINQHDNNSGVIDQHDRNNDAISKQKINNDVINENSNDIVMKQINNSSIVSDNSPTNDVTNHTNHKIETINPNNEVVKQDNQKDDKVLDDHTTDTKTYNDTLNESKSIDVIIEDAKVLDDDISDVRVNDDHSNSSEKDITRVFEEWMTKTKRIKNFDWKSFEKKCQKTYDASLMSSGSDPSDPNSYYDFKLELSQGFTKEASSDDKDKIKASRDRKAEMEQKVAKYFTKFEKESSPPCEDPTPAINNVMTEKSDIENNLETSSSEKMEDHNHTDVSWTVLEKSSHTKESEPSTWIETVQLEKFGIVVDIPEALYTEEGSGKISEAHKEEKFTSIKSLLISDTTLDVFHQTVGLDEVLEVRGDLKDCPELCDVTSEDDTMTISNESFDSEILEDTQGSRRKKRGLRVRLKDSPWEKLVLEKRENILVSRSGESTSGVSSGSTSDEEKDKVKQTEDGPADTGPQNKVTIKSRLPIPVKRQTSVPLDNKSTPRLRSSQNPAPDSSDKVQLGTRKSVPIGSSTFRLCKDSDLAKRSHMSASTDSLDKCVPRIYAKTTVSQSLKVLPNMGPRKAIRSQTSLNLRKSAPSEGAERLSRTSSLSTTELAKKVTSKPTTLVKSGPTLSQTKKTVSAPLTKAILSTKTTPSDKMTPLKKVPAMKEARKTSTTREAKLNTRTAPSIEKKLITERLCNRHALCTVSKSTVLSTNLSHKKVTTRTVSR